MQINIHFSGQFIGLLQGEKKFPRLR